MASTVLTLALDAASTARFEALRQAHYPAALNRIPAHLTLFHKLPKEDAARELLRACATATRAFEARVAGVMFLGRGVAFGVESEALLQLHAELSRAFAADLSAQDRQRFRPHVVVQNRVSAEEARALCEHLAAQFTPWGLRAEGLLWWEYLGGPWKPIERFDFAM